MNISLEQWYRIPYYNGYEILFSKLYVWPQSVAYDFNGESVYVTVRSFKNFNVYPGGYLLPYEHYNTKTKKKKNYFELTDLANKRRRLTIQAIIKVIENYDLTMTTEQNITNIGSRNKVRLYTDKKPILPSTAMNEEIVVNLKPTKQKEKVIPKLYTEKKPKMKDAIIFY